MVVSISIIIAIFCVVVISFPILNSRNTRQSDNPLDVVNELSSKRQIIYQELVMLEEAIHIGSITDIEFQSMTENLKRRAANNLYSQQQWEQQLGTLDEELEQLILHVSDPSNSDQNMASCSECGRMNFAHQIKCTSCNANLPDEMQSSYDNDSVT